MRSKVACKIIKKSKLIIFIAVAQIRANFIIFVQMNHFESVEAVIVVIKFPSLPAFYSVGKHLAGMLLQFNEIHQAYELL